MEGLIDTLALDLDSSAIIVYRLMFVTRMSGREPIASRTKRWLLNGSRCCCLVQSLALHWGLDLLC